CRCWQAGPDYHNLHAKHGRCPLRCDPGLAHMRIINPNSFQVDDYIRARDAGISVAFWQPGVDIEGLAQDYSGPPAIILPDDNDKTRLFAVPYDKAKQQRQNTIDVFGIEQGNLFCSSVPKLWNTTWLIVEEMGGQYLAPRAGEEFTYRTVFDL